MVAIGSRANDIILEGNKRLDAYTNLRILMEKKRIVLNKNDDKFRLQFGSYGVEETNGGIRIVKSDVYHDDLVDALVLALRGVDNISICSFIGSNNSIALNTARHKTSILDI